MTLLEALKGAQQCFNSISDTARLDAECLLSFAINKPSVYLRTWPEEILEPAQEDKFYSLVARRERGEPIAYILEQKQFWSLDLKVTKDTLIPRPETEILVEKILAINNTQTINSILDLGTGSGAIAIALASELIKNNTSLSVVATDISSKALQIAKLNAETHNQSIEFQQSDWFDSIALQKFDVIVSNPPYIEEDDAHLSLGDVRFEPMNALVSGDDGLTAIRSIIKSAKSWLNPNGWLLFEHGYNQADMIRQLFLESGYKNIQTEKDLSLNDRISFALNN